MHGLGTIQFCHRGVRVVVGEIITVTGVGYGQLGSEVFFGVFFFGGWGG